MQHNDSQTALSLTGVSRIFANGTQALSDVSFQVRRGEFVVIAGSNGSGKSVLMSLIAGLDEPSSGTIEPSITERRAGLVFQDADSQILGETPEEDVAFGARNCGLRKNALSECVERSLNQVGLLHKRENPARFLSGGEKRRLAVASILAMDCSLILFDEPFANLDWPGVRQVCAVLKELKAQKKTIIVLTHELEKVLAIADRFIVLDRGNICFDGTPQEGLKQPLDQWSIRNPLASYTLLEDMVWA